jgi:hypothetical protein
MFAVVHQRGEFGPARAELIGDMPPALMRGRGIECPVINGASTGTFEFEAGSGVYTELQCRSYIFMDADYGRNLDRDGAPTKAFEPSLFVWATVMSRPAEDRAIVDAGRKALAFDADPPLACDEPAANCERASDEHGRLAVSAATSRLALGDKRSPAIAIPPSTSTTGTSASATTASSTSGQSPPAARFINAETESATGGLHSSGTPALRRPARYVASYKARIFGTPKCRMALMRVMLE